VNGRKRGRKPAVLNGKVSGKREVRIGDKMLEGGGWIAMLLGGNHA